MRSPADNELIDPVVEGLRLQVERLEREVGDLEAEKAVLVAKLDEVKQLVLNTVVLPRIGG